MALKGNPAFDWPPATTKLWRYMDLGKFIWCLANEALFFARAHVLGDRFEASTPIQNISDYHELEKTMGDKVAVAKHFGAAKKAFLLYYLVNCWHMNEVESAAMWRLYSSDGKSIALLTMFDVLVDVLPTDFGIGKIRYIDYAQEGIPERNVYYPIMHKMKSFEHERELRAVKIDDRLDANALQKLYESSETEYKMHLQEMNPGVSVPVDIAHMIQSVRVSPGSPKWFADVVQKTVQSFGYNFSVERSELDRDPVY